LLYRDVRDIQYINQSSDVIAVGMTDYHHIHVIHRILTQVSHDSRAGSGLSPVDKNVEAGRILDKNRVSLSNIDE
jgi:uncharacterized protein (UPF0264 family)